MFHPKISLSVSVCINAALVFGLTFGAICPLLAQTSQKSTPQQSTTKSGAVRQKPGEMLANGNFADGLAKWKIEESGAKSKAEVVKEGPNRLPALRLEVLQIGDQSWRLQMYNPGLKIETGRKYTLTFWAKAKTAGVITVNCMQNHAPWEHHGAARELPLSTKWEKIVFAFDGPWDESDARITFTNLGTAVGQVYWFADCSLTVTGQRKAAVVAPVAVATPAETRKTPQPEPITTLLEPVGMYSSPVKAHGALQVIGTKICDSRGKPYQMKGMSLFWSQWSGPYYNSATVNALAEDWRCSVVRIAMGAEEGKGGYLENPEATLAKVKTVVDAAIAKGIYVIIDWHEEQAVKHLPQATAFFKQMATIYGKYPHVIFEIYNEPNGPQWPAIKSYSEAVIAAIRKTGSNNLIVVGTPRWSQDVDIAAENPITGYKNIAYSLHFYAGTHRQFLRDKATQAMKRGMALFVTEWGTCDASGNGGLDFAESQVWLDFLDANNISWANFSLNDKAETTSTLKPGTLVNGRPKFSDLTPAGAFVFNHLVAP